MKNKHAFSLIEVALYCSIFSLLALFVFGYWHTIHLSIKNFRSRAHHMSSLMLAFSVLCEDIRSAENQKRDSNDTGVLLLRHKKVTKTGFKQSTVGWRLDNKRLLRDVGIYDFIHRTWIERSTHVLAHQVAAFSWKGVYKNERLLAVSFSCGLRDSTKPLTATIYLRNSVL